MKTIIAGSRTITNYCTLVRAIIAAESEGIAISEVVSGTARGVDQMGEHYARNAGLPVQRFPADWKQYGKRAGYLRNKQMAEYAAAAIILWDGESKGTKHMIDLARAAGLKVYVAQVVSPPRPRYT